MHVASMTWSRNESPPQGAFRNGLRTSLAALHVGGVAVLGMMFRAPTGLASSLRQQIDLDVLADRLLAPVQASVGPRSANVWLASVTIPERASGTTEA
jgi:hypothetical protein